MDIEVRLDNRIEGVLLVYGIAYEGILISRTAAEHVAEGAKGMPLQGAPGFVIVDTRIEGDQRSGQVIAIAEKAA
jgi:hypothetical protein